MAEKIKIELGSPNKTPAMKALATLIGLYCAHDGDASQKLRASDGLFEVEMRINGAEIRASKLIDLINRYCEA